MNFCQSGVTGYLSQFNSIRKGSRTRQRRQIKTWGKRSGRETEFRLIRKIPRERLNGRPGIFFLPFGFAKIPWTWKPHHQARACECGTTESRLQSREGDKPTPGHCNLTWISWSAAREKRAVAKEGALMVACGLLDMPHCSLGAPKRFLSSLWFLFTSWATATA
jgi:hypothetical protein